MFRYFFKKNIIVFLKPKLISADAITPLLLELKAHRPAYNFHILVPNDSWPNSTIERGTRTYNLLKKNFVLWKALKKIGSIRICPLYHNKNKSVLKNKLERLKELVMLSALIFMSKHSYVFYFSPWMSNTYLFRSLRFFNRKKGSFFLVESAIYTSEKFITTENKLIGNKIRKFPHAADDISLSFSSYHYKLQSNKQERYLLGYPHKFSRWVHLIEKQTQDFKSKLKEQYPQHNGKKIITFFLGIVDNTPLGWSYSVLRDESSLQDLFLKIISVLNEFHDNLLVLLKPHYITNTKYVKRVIDNLKDNNFVITNAHPHVLVSLSSAQIANLYSTTFWEGKFLGIPTIEFSDYSDEFREITNEKSLDDDPVDFLIDNNEKELKYIVGRIINQKEWLDLKPIPSGCRVDLNFIEERIVR